MAFTLCDTFTNYSSIFLLPFAQLFNVSCSRELISKFRDFSSVGLIHLWNYLKSLSVLIDLNQHPGKIAHGISSHPRMKWLLINHEEKKIIYITLYVFVLAAGVHWAPSHAPALSDRCCSSRSLTLGLFL